MDESKVAGLSELLELLAIVDKKSVEEGVVLVPDAGLGDDAGGFFDDEQIVVLVFDRESDAFVGLDGA